MRCVVTAPIGGGFEIDCVGGRFRIMSIDDQFVKILDKHQFQSSWHHCHPPQPSQNVAFHITALFLRYEYQFVCTLCQASHVETWLTCDTFSILFEKPSHLHLHLSKLCLQLAATNCRSWGASAATKKSNDYKGKHCDPRTLSLDLHFSCDDDALREWRVALWYREHFLFIQHQTNFQLEFSRLALRMSF